MKMKKLLSLGLTFAMVLGVAPTMAFAAGKSATPTNSQVLVNGKAVAFDAYTIDGNNYFKLRDLASALNGSEKQFEVTWDGAKSAINVLPAKAYTAAGGELQKGDGVAKNATLSTAKTYISGNLASLTAYTINGNNYFKLRDLMQSINVYVGWDGAKNVITLETAKGYENAAPAEKPAEDGFTLDYKAIASWVDAGFIGTDGSGSPVVMAIDAANEYAIIIFGDNSDMTAASFVGPITYSGDMASIKDEANGSTLTFSVSQIDNLTLGLDMGDIGKATIKATTKDEVLATLKAAIENYKHIAE